MSKILILGAGAMGSAFTFPCIDNGHDVSLIGSPLENNVIDKLNNKKKFHPVLRLQLPKKLKIFKVNKLTEKLREKPDLIVVGVNSKGIEWIAREIARVHNKKTSILLLTKGLSLTDNKINTLSDKFRLMMDSFKFKNFTLTAVAGPCLAKNLAQKSKTSVVFANANIKIAKKISKFIETDYYNIECSKDEYGVEICAAFKNFYSMIVGSAKDLNTASVIFQRSVLEMAKFVKMFGGSENTAYGLAGLGDLHVSSAGGRNSKMGKYLGEGYLYTNAKSKFMRNETVEGAELAFEIGSKILNKFHKKKFPLMHSLVDAIYHNKKLKIKW
tara:strand:- start:120 stop:1103 length:984 start_codon:yes stop_codon:yes gene_type:complete